MNADHVFLSIQVDDSTTIAQVRALRKWLDDYLYQQDLTASIDAVEYTPTGKYYLEIAFGPGTTTQDFDIMLTATKAAMRRQGMRAVFYHYTPTAYPLQSSSVE